MKTALVIFVFLLTSSNSLSADNRSSSAPETDASADSTDAASDDSGLSADGLRTAYREVIQKSARKRKPDPFEVVPELTCLYVALADAKGMSHADSSRMRKGVKRRLEELRDRMLRAARREEASKRRRPRSQAATDRSTGRASQTAAASGLSQKRRAADATARRSDVDPAGTTASTRPGGSGEAATVRELIDLIQSTIAPQTWAANGGRGTISYYSPLKVLVIRQTGEVHHELGGTLDVLRR